MTGQLEPRISEAEPARPANGSKPAKARVPDFFIVGHQKCGTTALSLILRSHPQIYMPDIKEPWYFAPELRAGSGRRASKSATHTLDGYLALFAAATSEQRAGEASPQYIRSRTAAGAIAAMQPDARVIVLLREPAAFLRSFHLQMVANHVESERDFSKALALEAVRRCGEQIPRGCASPPSLLYSDHVAYVEQLRRFHDVFPESQVLVLAYEDFRRDNRAIVGEVLRFLDVDDTFPVEAVETKPLNAVRSMPLHKLRRAIRRAGLNPAAKGRVSRAIDTFAPRRLRSDAVAAMLRRVAYEAPDAPDEDLMLELRRRFKPEVVAVSEYLGRDLVTEWGYDRIS